MRGEGWGVKSAWSRFEGFGFVLGFTLGFASGFASRAWDPMPIIGLWVCNRGMELGIIMGWH